MKQMLNLGTLVVLLGALVAAGCATTGGASDAEQIDAFLGEWAAAIVAADLDKMMATYSENFTHDGYEYDAADKAALREYTQGSIDMGNFEDVELNVEDADVEIEGKTATVYPIEYSIAEGTITIELFLAKEKAGWLITDMAIEGL